MLAGVLVAGVLLGAALLWCALWPHTRRSSSVLQLRAWVGYTVLTVVPCVGLLMSLVLAAVLHHDNVTSTHCRVPNFWPSVSAAIGNNEPERFVWKLTVGLHNVLVLLDSGMAYDRLVQSPLVSVFLARLMAVCKALSCCGLFVLTFVSSTDNFLVHEMGFVAWLVFGSSGLLLFTGLWRRSVRLVTPREHFTWAWLRVCVAAYVLGLAGAMLAYYVHNEYCLPYVYSFFGICEAIVIYAYVFGLGIGPAVAFVDKDSVFELRF
jgi:hypothetical protein